MYTMLGKADIQICGRLVFNPESRTTTTGKKVCSFKIAHNYKEFNKSTNTSEDVSIFLGGEAWEHVAKDLETCGKGSIVLVEGQLKMNSYIDKKDNQKKENLTIKANKIYVLDKKEASDVKGVFQQPQQHPQTQQFPPQANTQYNQGYNQGHQPPQQNAPQAQVNSPFQNTPNYNTNNFKS